MGWKSTIEMTRREMEQAAVAEMTPDLSDLTDDELTDLLEILRGGEKHGHNYRVVPCATTTS